MLRTFLLKKERLSEETWTKVMYTYHLHNISLPKFTKARIEFPAAYRTAVFVMSAHMKRGRTAHTARNRERIAMVALERDIALGHSLDGFVPLSGEIRRAGS